MGSVQNSTIYHCCVSNGGRILYEYNSGGDHEMEKLAALCLEKAPSHHKWYFQTMFKKTFGFLMEDGYVFFAIVDENLGNPRVLKFLEHVRDEFKKAAKKGTSRSTTSNLNSLILQERLVPVIHQLINSLEHVTDTTGGKETSSSPYNEGLSPSPTSNDDNGQVEMGVSTKAPLLGKPSKQEKRKTRDHVISITENGVGEERRKSGDRAIRAESSSLDATSNVAAVSLSKDMSGSMARRSSAQTIRNKWCRQVCIVLAIDAVVCLILFIVWIAVCRGIECIS